MALMNWDLSDDEVSHTDKSDKVPHAGKSDKVPHAGKSDKLKKKRSLKEKSEECQPGKCTV